MKQVKMTSLLDLPRDDVVFQREWTAKGELGKRGMLLEVAFFAGTVGPGLYLASCRHLFHPGLLAGFLIVLFGYGLPHMLFLGRIERFWRGLLKPQSSWISRGYVFANLFLLFGFLSVANYFPLLNWGPLQRCSSAFSAILLAGAAFALLLAAYPGFLFSVLRAIPLWHSIVLIPLLMVQAVGGGLSLMLILVQVPGVSGPAVGELLAPAAIMIATSGILIAAHLCTRRLAGVSGRAAVRPLVAGEYRGLFIFGAFLCGIIVPLALIALVQLGVYVAALAAMAAVFQLTGVLLFKYCLLNAGAYSKLYSERLLGTR